MKRLDPDTGKPFVRGKIRKDGFLFWGYTPPIKKDGFTHETWLSPLKFKNKKELHKILTKEAQAKSRKTILGRAKALLNKAKYRSSKYNREFDLTLDWVLKKLEEETCELSGRKFNFTQLGNHKTHPDSPSIDRIDSNLGYTKNNCRIIVTSLNCALGSHGIEHLIQLVNDVISYQKGK
jgi:hypothetical protein